MPAARQAIRARQGAAPIWFDKDRRAVKTRPEGITAMFAQALADPLPEARA
jgi:hypothetical protein